MGQMTPEAMTSASDLAALPCAPVPGTGLLVRAGAVLLLVGETDDLPAYVSLARDAAGREDAARWLIRGLAGRLADLDETPSTVAVVPHEGSLAVFVSGDAHASVDDASITARGALGWEERLVELPASRIQAALPGAEIPAAAGYDLRDGAVPAGGFVVGTPAALGAAVEAGLSPFSGTRMRAVPVLDDDAEPALEATPAMVNEKADEFAAAPPPPPPPPSPSPAPAPPVANSGGSDRPSAAPVPPIPGGFEVADLSADDDEPAPLPLSGGHGHGHGHGHLTPPDPVAVAPGERPRDPAALAAATGASLVRGVYCKNNHFNDPRQLFCGVCGINMVQQTPVLVEGVRPPLGVLVVDDGGVFQIDDRYLIGRDPAPDPRVVDGTFRALQLQGDASQVSRVHALLEIRGWDVVLIDSGSTNGTFVFEEGGFAERRVQPGGEVVLVPGMQVRFGNRVMQFNTHHG